MRLFWLDLILFIIVGCTSTTIQSTNLTGLDIPEHVDQRVYEFLDDKEGVTSLSIVYLSKLILEPEVEEVSICYEATVAGIDDLRYYGLVSRVNGKWFVTVPSLEGDFSDCPVYKGM